MMPISVSILFVFACLNGRGEGLPINSLWFNFPADTKHSYFVFEDEFLMIGVSFGLFDKVENRKRVPKAHMTNCVFKIRVNIYMGGAEISDFWGIFCLKTMTTTIIT